MNKLVKIGNTEIGGEKTFIIAEVGSNHCQDIKIAKESIDAAAEAGADAVKFQSIRLDRLYLNPPLKLLHYTKKSTFRKNGTKS